MMSPKTGLILTQNPIKGAQILAGQRFFQKRQLRIVALRWNISLPGGNTGFSQKQQFFMKNVKSDIFAVYIRKSILGAVAGKNQRLNIRGASGVTG